MKLGIRSLLFGVLTAGIPYSSLVGQDATIPPSVERVSPPGVRRGTTTKVTLGGRNVSNIRAVLFDTPGITAKFLDVTNLPEEKKEGLSTAAEVPLGTRQEATVELTLSESVEPGIHHFRVQTPLGTSNLQTLDIGFLPELQESKDAASGIQQVVLPATMVGTLAWPGDVDNYQLEARAGEELVFETVAAALGSELRAVLTLRDSTGKEISRSGENSRQRDPVLTVTIPADGKYVFTVSDLAQAGGRNFFYRIHAGPLPYATEVFPLGVRAGESSELAVKGSNLGGVRSVKVDAPTGESNWQTIPLRFKTPQGETLNLIRLEVGKEPELTESEPNDSPQSAQPISLPLTVNGRIQGKNSGKADEDYYRFMAHKGDKIVAEVAAERLGSALDSVIEILDEKGQEIRTASVRCVLELTTTLADRDSKSLGYRFVSLSGLREGDYVMVDDEINRITYLSDQPDEDARLRSFGGERFAELNTSPQAHAINTTGYKVRIMEPDRQFPPNGLPVFYLTARNDDGGPGYRADSRLEFTAPRDGDYCLRIKDVRGLEGEGFAYRLTIRHASQDFILSATPANPNVPLGGKVPVQVSVNRALGYQGAVDVELKGLPKGLSAQPAVIPAGQDSAVIVVEASADPGLTQIPPSPVEVVGRGSIDGHTIERVANQMLPLRVASVMPAPDILVAAEPKEVILEPGGKVEVTLHVERKNNFHGRVPCNALGLPPGVTIENTGLNGVMVSEKQSSRTFKLVAADWAPAADQTFYVIGQVESNSTTTHASSPLQITVRPRRMASAPSTSNTTAR